MAENTCWALRHPNVCCLLSQLRWADGWEVKVPAEGGTVHKLKRLHINHVKGREEKEDQSRLKYTIMSDSIVAASPILV